MRSVGHPTWPNMTQHGQTLAQDGQLNPQDGHRWPSWEGFPNCFKICPLGKASWRFSPKMAKMATRSPPPWCRVEGGMPHKMLPRPRGIVAERSYSLVGQTFLSALRLRQA